MAVNPQEMGFSQLGLEYEWHLGDERSGRDC